jgi:hypothetical protein
MRVSEAQVTPLVAGSGYRRLAVLLAVVKAIY